VSEARHVLRPSHNVLHAAVIKVIVVGNGAVGKTSMINRFCRGGFGADYNKTIGVDFVERADYEVESIGETLTMHVWDTAGQEEYDAVTSQYYRDADGCVLAFSTIDEASFKAVKKWKGKVEDHCPGVPMVIVQNKIDLLSEAAVQQAEVEALAVELNMKLFRVSVKDNTNVNEVFDAIAEMWAKQRNAKATIPEASATAGDSSNSVDPSKPRSRGEKKTGSCSC